MPHKRVEPGIGIGLQDPGIAGEMTLEVLNSIGAPKISESETSMTAASDLAARRALEAARVIFIGVRVRKRQKDKARKQSVVSRLFCTLIS
jgi:hypothetical protein